MIVTMRILADPFLFWLFVCSCSPSTQISIISRAFSCHKSCVRLNFDCRIYWIKRKKKLSLNVAFFLFCTYLHLRFRKTHKIDWAVRSVPCTIFLLANTEREEKKNHFSFCFAIWYTHASSREILAHSVCTCTNWKNIFKSV